MSPLPLLGSLVIAQGGANRLRENAPFLIVAVGMSGPGQVTAEEAVVVATRHDVDMEVGALRYSP